MGLIYLDNAATSFPKPPSVYEQVNRCMRQLGGNPGRGSHPLALAASEVIYDCRERLAAYLGVPAPENITFTLNTTYALNFLLKGLLRQGDHVLISDMEHNAVLRPLEKLRRAGKITYDVFSTMLGESELPHRDSRSICARIGALCRPNTRAVVCSHQSNLVSASLPLDAIGEFCRRRGLLLIVDAAQSAGHLPLNMEKMHVDAIAAPGHKGLLGIQGCGFLALREGLLPETLIEGGSGYRSLDPLMPEELPEREEAGTLPTPAIASLAAGVRFLEESDRDQLRRHEKMLFSALCDRLRSLGREYTVYLPSMPGSALLFHRNGIAADRIGQYLGENGICLRAGYHCAALGHKTLHTPEGGALRASFGVFNDIRDVDALYRTLARMEFLHEVEPRT